MRLTRDLREFFELLNSEHVEYVIVGGWALGFHALPRYTQDIDVFIRPTEENASRMERVLQRFGFASLGLSRTDFLTPGGVIQLGHPPNRIDLLTALTGLEQDQGWDARQAGDLDGVPVFFLSRAMLIKNKRATGRPRDLADLEELI